MTNPNDCIFAKGVDIDANNKVSPHGLTKREYFAAMAMQANRQMYPKEFSEQVARNAMSDADALIKCLSEDKNAK